MAGTRISPRSGVVRLDGQRVGVIQEDGRGGTVFTYDAQWCARPAPKAISLTLPVRPEPYTHMGLHPFFAGLLSEGWMRRIAVETLGLDAKDDFGLLIATCADCIGAVEVVGADE